MMSSQQGPRNFKPAKWVTAACLAICCQAGTAFSAGLGEIKVLSRMGQPFVGDIELINVNRTELSNLQVTLAPPSAYEAANLRFDPALNALKLSVERRANGTPYVRATSFRRVNEPYLDLLVDLVSPDGKIRRNYAALLDPPEFAESVGTSPKAATTPTSPAPARAVPAVRADAGVPVAPPATRVRRQAVAQQPGTGAPTPATPAPVPAPVPPAPTAATPAPRTPATPPATAATAAVPADAKPVEPAKSEAPKDAPVETAPATPVATGTQGTQRSTGAAPEAPAPAPKKVNPPVPQPGLMDSVKDYLLPVGGGILALLAILAGLLAWRRKKAASDPLVYAYTPTSDTPATRTITAPVAAAAASVLPASPLVNSKQLETPSDAAPVEHTVSNVSDMVDPVEEATVYLNHSQDETAEKILRETLSKQPGREDALMLLLEILAQRGDTESFNQLAGRLHKQTGGLGTNWKRAMAMGFALDPGYPLYSPPGSAPAQTTRGPSTEIEPPRTAPEAEDMGNTIDINLSSTNAALDMDKTMVLPYAGTKPAAPPAEPLPDINFELPAASKPAAAPDAVPEMSAPPAVKDMAPLDFKIDLPDFGNTPKSTPAPTATTGHDEHWENVQQKLDLARAYREMGDKDGAMELIEEIQREGDAAQQADARQILESFG